VQTYIPINRFEIERTEDGSNWHTIAVLEASSTELAYQHIDKTPFYGVSYYRLKQVGLAQEIAYSNMVAINIALSEAQVKVYPNPATKFVQVEMPNKKAYTIKLTNALGQVLPAHTVQEGKIFTLDLKACRQGVYYLHILDAQKAIVKKVVVQ
jgi:hypothetical protein